jgi:hypothetical protein
MIQTPVAESIPQFERVSADTIVLTQRPEHRPIANIIAQDWNTLGQAIGKRPFVISTIRDRHGDIESLSIRIDGTPARGHVIVGLSDPDLCVRLGHTCKSMGRRDTMLLNHFARQIVAAVWEGRKR